MCEYRRTFKGLRADHGGLRQVDVAKKLGIAMASYNGIEQFVDDPAIVESIEDLYGIKIKIEISEAE